MNLADTSRPVRYSANDRRFYSSRDMAELKRLESIMHAERKRKGKRPTNTDVRPCLCGEEGCFIVN